MGMVVHCAVWDGVRLGKVWGAPAALASVGDHEAHCVDPLPPPSGSGWGTLSGASREKSARFLCKGQGQGGGELAMDGELSVILPRMQREAATRRTRADPPSAKAGVAAGGPFGGESVRGRARRTRHPGPLNCYGMRRGGQMCWEGEGGGGVKARQGQSKDLLACSVIF